jgi:hypothetical protein
LEEKVKRTWPDSIQAVGRAYALTSFAAARQSQVDSRQRQLFERCYVSACAYLMSPPGKHHVTLAMADALAGASGRAWVGAVDLPDPESRVRVVTLVIRDASKQGQLEEARKIFTYLDDAHGAPQAASYIAEAEVRFGNRSFEALKRWAEGLPTAADQAAALIGIAAGVKAGASKRRPVTRQQEQDLAASNVEGAVNEEVPALRRNGDHANGARQSHEVSRLNRHDAQLQELIDENVALVPGRLLDLAILLTEDVDDTCVQACLWLQIAQAQRRAGDDEGCLVSLKRSKGCCISKWHEILDGRLPPEKYRDGSYHWREDHRRRDAEFDSITAVLRVLMDLEQVHHEHGHRSEAVDTLLLALRCTEQLPTETGVLKKPKPGDAWSWMTRIAGRLAHRGRNDLAQPLLADGPWFPDQENHLSRKFLLSLAAAATDDLPQLETLAAATKKRADSYNDSQERTYASLVNAQIALVSARKGDRERYRRAAMTIGGYISQPRAPASKSVLLYLAKAATAVGKVDVARQYIEQSGITGVQRDVALLAVAERLVEVGRVADGRNVVESLEDELAAIRGWYVVSTAEAAATSAHPSDLIEGTKSLPRSSCRAASLAGIGVGLLAK